MNFDEVRAEAIKLLLPSKPDHPRISIFVGFEVEPASYSDCPHCETPEEALKEAQREDSWEQEIKDIKARASGLGDRIQIPGHEIDLGNAGLSNQKVLGKE